MPLAKAVSSASVSLPSPIQLLHLGQQLLLPLLPPRLLWLLSHLYCCPSFRIFLLPPLQPLFCYLSSNWGNCCCCWWNAAISAAPKSFTTLLLKLPLNCFKCATSRSSNCCSEPWEVRNNKSYIISFLTGLGGNPLDTSTTRLPLKPGFYSFSTGFSIQGIKSWHSGQNFFFISKISASWDHRICCLLLLACSGDALYCVAQLIRLIGAHYHHQHQGTLAQRPEKGENRAFVLLSTGAMTEPAEGSNCLQSAQTTC